MDLSLEEEPCVVETRCLALKRLRRNSLETDDGLAEKADDSVSIEIIKAQPRGLLESQLARDIKPF